MRFTPQPDSDGFHQRSVTSAGREDRLSRVPPMLPTTLHPLTFALKRPSQPRGPASISLIVNGPDVLSLHVKLPPIVPRCPACVYVPLKVHEKIDGVPCAVDIVTFVPDCAIDATLRSTVCVGAVQPAVPRSTRTTR